MNGRRRSFWCHDNLWKMVGKKSSNISKTIRDAISKTVDPEDTLEVRKEPWPKTKKSSN